MRACTSTVRLLRAGWVFCLVGSLVGAALAQSPASPSDSGRQFEAGRGAELQNWEWRARQGVPPTESERAVQTVVDAVSQRDCAAAVTRLNAGLGKAFPAVMMLAGAMYEDGLCLKPNWERAVAMYQHADSLRQPGAAARLAAGYAGAAGGRDRAAALWWGLRARTAMPDLCRQPAMVSDDPDKFVAALNAWPAGQLDACVYAVAVMATVQAEVESAALASIYGLEGKLRFTFLPAQGRIDIADELEPAQPATGVIADAALREREGRAARSALGPALRRMADRALARHDKPAVVPAAWRIEAEHLLKMPK